MTVPPVSLSHKVGGVLGRKSVKWTQLEIPATRFSCVTSGSCRPKLGLCILSLVVTVGLCLILVPLLVDTPKMAAEPQTLQNEEAVKAVAKANQDFNGKLYPLLAKGVGATDNLVASPFSVSSVLSMVFAGAGGNTAAELKSGLSLPDDESLLTSGFEGLVGALRSNENFTLDTANRLYVQQNFKLLDEYLKLTAAHFKAEAENVDFATSAEAVRTTINTWVEEKTNQKIKNLIPEGVLGELTRLVLVNAVYFKGDWQDKFDPKMTRKMDFEVTPGGEKVEVDMMRRSGNYKGAFNKELGASILQMPYKGDRVHMYIALPNKPEEFAEVEQKWANFDFLGLELARAIKFDVSLPRFKLEAKHDLEDALSALGMKEMFDQNKADFSKMTSEPTGLFVSKVLQKAFIEVNEEGAEAAAATAGIMMTRAMIRTPEVICNRPFLFAIQDSLTGMLLFSGRVMNPTKN